MSQGVDYNPNRKTLFMRNGYAEDTVDVDAKSKACSFVTRNP